MTTSFIEMGLNPQLLNALEQLGFTTATPVQADLVPKALEGGDWIVSSQTGSGKTAAFLLPALELIFQNKANQVKQSHTAPWALVLCPTRELAQQVSNDAISLVKGAKGIRIATVTGGASYFQQRKQVTGAQLVVATPGRLLDLAQSGAIDLSEVQLLMLDEADRMLDFGFSEEIHNIADQCTQREQTLMFSATFTPRETRLAADLMDNPQRISIDSAQDKHDNITQHLHWVDNSNHQNQLLQHWLKATDLDQAIIFANTQLEAERMAKELEEQGYLAAALHGGMPQQVRNRRLDALRRGRTKILVATDVAARGIDVPTITHVFNFGLPMKAEDYVHRIGRTGRAGRTGTAVTFAQYSDGRRLRDVERYTQQKIAPKVVEGLEPQNKPEEYERANRGKHSRNGSGRGGNSRGGYSGSGRSFGDRREGGFGGDRREGSYGNRREGGFSGDRREGSGGYRGQGGQSAGGYNHRPRTDGNFADRAPFERRSDDRRGAPRDRDGNRADYGQRTHRSDAAKPAWQKNERPAHHSGEHSERAPRGEFGGRSDRGGNGERSFGNDRPRSSAPRGNGGNGRPQRSRSGY